MRAICGQSIDTFAHWESQTREASPGVICGGSRGIRWNQAPNSAFWTGSSLDLGPAILCGVLFGVNRLAFEIGTRYALCHYRGAAPGELRLSRKSEVLPLWLAMSLGLAVFWTGLATLIARFFE